MCVLITGAGNRLGRARVEAVERGDELRYRIRCRWKGEEAACWCGFELA
jgi:hypothetical protein